MWEAPLAQASVSPSTFRHSLQAEVPEADGVILLDDKDDDFGNRFANGNWVSLREGSAEKFSGVFTLQSSPISTDQYARAEPSPPDVAIPTIGNALSDKIASDRTGARIDVSMHLVDPPGYVPMIYKIKRHIATGQIQSDQDMLAVRRQLMNEQSSQVGRVVSRVASFLERRGGIVTLRCRAIPCLQASVTPDQLESLALHPDVVRIDSASEPEASSISGVAVSRGTQMDDPDYWGPGYVPMQFHDDNYLGDKWDAGDTPVYAGVLSHQQLDHDHPAFYDWNGGPSRIALMRGCGTSPCTTKTSWPSPQGHATKVSGVVMGDITQGQDPLISDDHEQERRSGFGREAELLFWRAPSDGNIPNALDDIAWWASYVDFHILNMSISEKVDQDPNCTGAYDTARDLNDVFEAGVLPIFASGNRGHANDWDCRVKPPGAAMGAFVVGSHTNNPASENQTDVRYGAISTFSDRGGVLARVDYARSFRFRGGM